MKPNAVMIVPTGLGCSIGGHAGDATPAARLLGAVCDKLILHPNVVNASDINEMPANAWYVEGSVLDRFLQGSVRLKLPRLGNKILVVANKLTPTIVNGVAAAKMTLGVEAVIKELSTPLRMNAMIVDKAVGNYSGVAELVEDVERMQYDALAVITPINVADEVALHYFDNGGVNPWGGIEAIVSKAIACRINKPVAHAPFVPKDDPLAKYNKVVDQRMAAEMVSTAYLFCIMKGLQWAPLFSSFSTFGGIGVSDIDVLVTPDGCWGPPHDACVQHDIPIMVVRENRCKVWTETKGHCKSVATYLEATGAIVAMGIGLGLESSKRQ